MQTHAISWFEIPVLDFARAKKFYSTILDADLHEMPMGEQLLGFLPCNPQEGGIGGALVFGIGYVPSKIGTKVYLNAGNNLDTVLNRVEAAGGKIITDKTEITPEYGYYAEFEDTEGNYVSLHSMS